jgi:hypothetical protein
MPGAPANTHFNWRRLLSIAQEANFGVAIAGGPDGAGWEIVPVLGDGMKLKAESPRFRPDTNIMGYQQSIAVHHQQEVAGSYTTLAFPQVAALAAQMAIVRAAATDDLRSYTLDLFTPPDPRQYLGTVAESLNLRVTGTGDADVQLELALRARQEVEANALVETDFTYAGDAIPFMFRDAVLQLEGATVTDVDEFTITVENNISQGPMRRFITPDGIPRGLVDYLVAGRRLITLELTKLNYNDAFNESIRDGGSLSFQANFFHPLGHLWTIQMPHVVFEGSEESTSGEDVTKEAPRGFAIAVTPDGDIAWEVDLGPTTTTLRPLTTTTEAPATTTAAP